LGILRGFKNSLAFLTIIPVGMDNDGIAQSAAHMPLFPVVGSLIGLLAGGFVWALELVLPSMVVGILGVGFLLLVNGVQHMDGLLDFGDGLMCHGSRKRRLRVMRDPQTGAGGLSLGVVVLVGTAMSIASLQRVNLVPSLIASEAAAKFATVFEAWGSRAAHRGMSSLFVDAMHQGHGSSKLVGSLSILLLISVSLLRQLGLLVSLVAILVSTAFIAIANRVLGGITGDVMGATNEITRLVSLLTILGAARWV
jgi:adenosylcobinamide-GDP ribazoletransferase